ncbi:MAG: carboxypeptidase regulatory-like domain-containing protein [Planctomycetes bacterium]|nr:carboxypeptidase regulatory-like domain-containing protein [Planctomycetota bacterium]
MRQLAANEVRINAWQGAFALGRQPDERLPACGVGGRIVGPEDGAPLQNIIVHAIPAPGSELPAVPPALWRGESLGAARVDRAAREAAGDAEGRFALDGLPPAASVCLLIKVSPALSPPLHELASVTTSNAGTVVDLGTLVFGREWTVVQGAVMRGKGVPGATVILQGQAWRCEEKTGTSGNFAFSCVPPGSYTLTARDDLGQVVKPVEVQAGRRQDFVLHLPAANETVTAGVVVNPRGEAVPRQLVVATTAAGDRSLTLSDDDGRFRIVTRAEDGGTLTLSSEPELAVPPLEVVPGRRDVRLVVPAMVTFYVALEVDEERPLTPLVSVAWRRMGEQTFVAAGGVQPVMHGGRPIVAIHVPEDARELCVGRSEEGAVGVTLDVATLSSDAAAPAVVRLP